MLLILSLSREKSTEIARATIKKVKRDGVLSFFIAVANRIYYVLTIFLFNSLFGSITRDEMIQQAQQSGGCWEYGSSEKIEIQNSENGSVPDLFTKYSGSYDVRRPFVCELNGGHLISGIDPLVLTRDKKVVMETEKPLFGPRNGATQADTPFHKRTEYSNRTTSDRMRQLCQGCVRSYNPFYEQARFESVFPLFRRDASYGHWLLDQLPTIRGLKRYKKATGREPTVVVEPNPPGWVQETLSLVGVTDIVPLEMPVAKADRLIVSSCRECVPRNQSVYEPSREDINWLSSEMKSRAPSTSTEHPDRIYISRENLTNRGRHVTNRTELNSVLEEFGIEVCTPETLSIGDQIRLYENAELIIGPHGAGLINMIFSRETCIVELLNKPYPMYRHLAQLCGHRYRYLQCKGGSDHHTPIEVDTTDLRNLLKSIDGVASPTA